VGRAGKRDAGGNQCFPYFLSFLKIVYILVKIKMEIVIDSLTLNNTNRNCVEFNFGGGGEKLSTHNHQSPINGQKDPTKICAYCLL